MACKTFKALFDFQGSSEADMLTFKRNTLLVVIETVNENWYYGCANGACGFIPVKYVYEVEVKNYTFMLQCINKCIEKLQYAPKKSAKNDGSSVLSKLIECREALYIEMSASKLTPVTKTAAMPMMSQPRKSQEVPKQLVSSNQSQKPLYVTSQPRKSQEVPKQPASSKHNNKPQYVPNQLQKSHEVAKQPTISSRPNQKPQYGPKQPQKSDEVLNKPVSSMETPKPQDEPKQPQTNQKILKQPVTLKQPQKPQQPQKKPANLPTKSKMHIPKNLSRQLIESIRASTNAPHKDCVLALKQLLVTLESQIADQSEELALIICQLAEQIMRSESEEPIEDEELDDTTRESRDWKTFNRLFSMAETRRQDWQERGGWSLHEKESQVLDELAQLSDLLASCQPSVARLRIKLDGCSGPLCLAELHTAETRPAVRVALVDCLIGMCVLDRLVVDALLGHTTLVTDLLTAIGTASVGNVESGSDTEAVMKRSLYLLSLVLSTNLPPPSTLFGLLDVRFFTNLLNHLASDDESVFQSIVTFLLTINNLPSKFSPSSAKLVPVQKRPMFRGLLAAPSEGRQAFVEAILSAFNRTEDPAAMVAHSPPAQDSVVKMLVDLFSHDSIVDGVLYSGDVQMLLDLLLRELCNASCDNKRLPQLLQLLGVCIATSSYRKSLHKRHDLIGALKQLQDQEAIRQPLKAKCQSLCQELKKLGG